MPTATTLDIQLNGQHRQAVVPDGQEPLLYALRNRLDQVGPKYGCGVSACGGCTVLLNGQEIRPCQVPVSSIPQGAAITTLDGLAGPSGAQGSGPPLHPLQAAFIAEQAAQCGFCMNGILMGSLAWLNRRRAVGKTGVPSEAEVGAFLTGQGPESTPGRAYYCRCGAHVRVIRAIRRAAREMWA